MKRTMLYSAGLVFLAAAAVAASDVLERSKADVIEISVPADQLDDCRETLSQVAEMPIVSDSGTPILFPDADELPSVICVADI